MVARFHARNERLIEREHRATAGLSALLNGQAHRLALVDVERYPWGQIHAERQGDDRGRLAVCREVADRHVQQPLAAVLEGDVLEDVAGLALLLLLLDQDLDLLAADHPSS